MMSSETYKNENVLVETKIKRKRLSVAYLN